MNLTGISSLENLQQNQRSEQVHSNPTLSKQKVTSKASILSGIGFSYSSLPLSGSVGYHLSEQKVTSEASKHFGIRFSDRPSFQSGRQIYFANEASVSYHDLITTAGHTGNFNQAITAFKKAHDRL